VLLPDGSAVTNTFRFDGLRYSKQEPQATTKFLWDFNNYLAETDARTKSKPSTPTSRNRTAT
jgi:hypothetical protein